MPEPALEALSTVELLAELRRRDVRCWADGDRLRCNAPEGALTERLQAEISRRKPEILAWLAAARVPEPPARPRLRRRVGGGPPPLSFSQERMWFLQQLEPQSVAYNLQTSLPLPGPLDRGALERSLGEVVRRHEILRTTFALVDGSPVQVVAEAVPLVLGAEDLGGLVQEERDDAAARVRSREARRPFDLERGPLFRPWLLRFGPDEHELLLTQHHIITDGWSIAVLIEEILALYAALSAGRPSPLPEPACHYADFAEAQREWLEGDVRERHLAYWRRQLAGLPVLELPTDRPRPATQSHEGAIQWLDLPADLSEGLRGLARREGATLFMVLLAAFQALLARYSGQEDVAVGVPTGSRSWVETERMLGLFLNTLVMRGDLSGDPTFPELLARVKQAALGAFAHEELPFERLVAELQPERDLSRSPLFQVLFILQNTPLEALASRPRPGRRLVTETGAAAFDLTLYVMDTAEGLRGYLEYATALFDPDTAVRMLGHLETLLRGIVADPDRPLSALPLMPADERERLLREWNETALAVPERSVQEQVAARAARAEDAVAVSDERRSLSYREVDRLASRLALRLRRLGAGPGTLVGIGMERSVEMVVALLGVLKAGAAYVPLDPAFPPARLALMREDARLELVITQTALVDTLPRTGVRPVFLDRVESLDEEAEGAALPAVAPDDLAYVIYTSGSTGRPKGVEVAHRGLTNFLAAMGREPGITPDDVLVSVTTLSFDIAGLEIYLPLVHGARVVLASRETAQDGRRLADALDRWGATLVQATPATWRLLIEAGWKGRPGLTILCGGEALSPELARELLSRGRALYNLYGPTETTIWSTVERLAAVDGPVSLGRPIANTRVYVLDGRREPVPVGVPGELYIGGDGVARGYLRRPDLTAERFVPDPFASARGARLYRTGDRVRLRVDGRLDYLGRVDHQTKVRGYRVELGEVEAALSAHPGVRACAVAARGDGSGQQRLFACIVARDGAGPSATELRAFLRERLPDYMIPSSFVRLDALPLTPNGKVDRRALPAPGPSRPELGALVPPRTPVEAEVAGLWREVLGVAEVGVHDDFFELGGHSILGTQMVSRLRDTLGVELPLRRLFETPTVAGVAAWIEAEGRAAVPAAPPLAPAPRGGRLSLSFAQERLWFLEQLEPGSPAYTIAGALRIRGPLDRGALERSLGEILRRHEALRTSFANVEGEPVPRVAAPAGLALEVQDLATLGPERSEAEARRLAQAESLRPFDLQKGPLFRARLLRLAAEDHALVLAMHHIVSDAWSLGVLVRELGALYRAFAAGEASPLPELTVQYADWAAWQRQWLGGAALERQLAYWRGQLAGGTPPLRLPTDRPRPPRRSAAGAHEVFQLPAALGEGLKALARRERLTFFMTLLAAFQALLHRVTGQDDIAVGSPISGRSRSETEGLIGLFVNTLVLRTPLSGDPTFRELLARVRDVALGAYAHQDLPFEKLVSELHPERNPSVNPLFQVMFVLQNAPLPGLALPGLALEPLGFERGTARFDLTLFMWDDPRGPLGALEYSTDVFDAPTVRRLLAAFRRLLEAMVASPDERVSRVGLLDPAERRQLLDEGVGAAAPSPGDAVHELFEAQVRMTPTAAAVVDGPVTLSFAELDRRANRLARHLRRLGVGPEVRVGVCLERSWRLMVGLLGVLKSGGAYLPLDPGQPEDRLAFMIEDSGTQLVLTEPALEKEVARIPVRRLLLGEDGDLDSGDGDALGRTASGDQLAYVIYTSGSTGRPKGTMITHRGLAHYLSWATAAYVTEGAGGSPVHSSVGFDLTVTSLFCPLLGGQAVTMVRDGDELAGALRAGRDYALVKITPAHLELLESQLAPPEVRPAARCYVVGGEALLGEALAFWRAHSPAVRVVNEYGPTETVVGCCVFEVPPGPVPPGPVPIGRPIPRTRLYVLDRHLEPVLPGVAGELFIGGDGVARGYLNRPEQTAERFVPDPFTIQAGARLYRTGDLVRRLGDGGLEYLGRVDHQVKIRGFRIELGEIEAVLAGHPGVEAAVVTVREHTPGDRHLTAHLVFGAGAPTVTELRRSLKKTLPAHMVPSSFAVLDALPLTPNGKVDRRALEGLGGRRAETGEAHVPPRTPMEALVATVFEEALGVERVGVHDNFFDLGGHSLLSLRVIARIEKRTGCRLGPRDLIFQTLEQLAATCEQRGGRIDPPRAEALETSDREASL
jgi:amino acid adenylation domain-containing protein